MMTSFLDESSDILLLIPSRLKDGESLPKLELMLSGELICLYGTYLKPLHGILFGVSSCPGLEYEIVLKSVGPDGNAEPLEQVLSGKTTATGISAGAFLPMTDLDFCHQSVEPKIYSTVWRFPVQCKDDSIAVFKMKFRLTDRFQGTSTNDGFVNNEIHVVRSDPLVQLSSRPRQEIRTETLTTAKVQVFDKDKNSLKGKEASKPQRCENGINLESKRIRKIFLKKRVCQSKMNDKSFNLKGEIDSSFDTFGGNSEPRKGLLGVQADRFSDAKVLVKDDKQVLIEVWSESYDISVLESAVGDGKFMTVYKRHL